MLTAYEAGFARADVKGLDIVRELSATTYSSDAITWQDMVTTFQEHVPAYLCILVFDQSVASDEIRDAVRKRYMDLDRLLKGSFLKPEH